MNPTNRLAHSKSLPFPTSARPIRKPIALPTRERREFKVYERMLETIPGVQDRLMASEGGEEVEIIASLVRTPFTSVPPT